MNHSIGVVDRQIDRTQANQRCQFRDRLKRRRFAALICQRPKPIPPESISDFHGMAHFTKARDGFGARQKKPDHGRLPEFVIGR